LAEYQEVVRRPRRAKFFDKSEINRAGNGSNRWPQPTNNAARGFAPHPYTYAEIIINNYKNLTMYR